MGNDLNIVAKGDTFVLRFAFSVYKLLDKSKFEDIVYYGGLLFGCDFILFSPFCFAVFRSAIYKGI